MPESTSPATSAETIALRCSLIISLLPTLALAEQPPPAGPVAKVEVVGVAPVDGLGVDRDLLPYSVQTAGDKAIRKAGGENLAEFMANNLTGVNVNEVSGSPFQNDITFRGFRASPVLGSSQGISVYLDGVRVNEPFGDVVNWDMIPESAIGELLLVPGANPLYGLNTLGGALVFRTKSGLTDPGGNLEFSLTDHGRRRTDFSYGQMNEGGLHSFVGATVFDDAGWRDHSAGRLGNMLVKIGRTTTPTDWSLSLLAGRSTMLGNGLLPDELYQADRRAVYTYPDTTRNRLVQGTLNFTHHFTRDRQLTALAYARDSRRDTVGGDINDAYADYVSDCAAGYGPDGAALQPTTCGLAREDGAALRPGVLNTTSTSQTGHGASLAFSDRHGTYQVDAGAGIDESKVQYAQFEQAAFISGDRQVNADPAAAREVGSSVVGKSRSAGVYGSISAEIALGTQITASVRYGQTRVVSTLSNDEGPQPTERFTYTRLNPSFGLTHVLSPRMTVFANIAQGNRVPTVIELGCADPQNPCRLPAGLQSDPYLKQVVARTLEVGARGRFQGGDASGSYSVSLHRTVNQDDILFLSSPSGQGYFSNFGRTLHQGIDTTFAGKSGRLSSHLSYSYLQAVYDADGQLFTGARNVLVRRGTPMAGMPRHSAKLSVDWAATQAVNIGADLQAFSRLPTQGNEDGLTEDPIEGESGQKTDWGVAGYAQLGLRASYRPTDKWEFFARVSNVFDRRYETYGMVAPNLFASGRLAAPHEEAGDISNTRFVAPGAPRTIVAGLRCSF